ncbi:MAG: hypothetical protein ABS52_16585 [Gemmatimonadetes bacterium SCN 70-22]|nr:MAG: hypothetical protein ABS52_16585 [Gemmatimonadetes bacterium SCN 70-22]
MTPDERAARLHLTDAAESLRVASERLCDWLEATGQDVAGNGHVASADEAAGSFREAPTAPVSSSPPPIPLGAVVGYHEWTGDAWAHRLVHAPNGEARCVSPDDDLHFALTALYHARREAEEAVAAALAAHEETRDWRTRLEWARDAVQSIDSVLGDAKLPNVAEHGGDLVVHVRGVVETLRDAERERDEARRELAEKEQQMADALAPFGYEFMDPPDGGDVPFGVQIARMGSALVEARRELAAERTPRTETPDVDTQRFIVAEWLRGGGVPDAKLTPSLWWCAQRGGLTFAPPSANPLGFVGGRAGGDSTGTPWNAAGLGVRAPNSEGATMPSPAPASAPRRWWVALAMDGTPLAVMSHVPTPEEWQPMWQRVVPVLEARVTREMVDRVEGIVRTARGTNRTSEHWAYEIVRALGLTVEE